MKTTRLAARFRSFLSAWFVSTFRACRATISLTTAGSEQLPGPPAEVQSREFAGQQIAEPVQVIEGEPKRVRSDLGTEWHWNHGAGGSFEEIAVSTVFGTDDRDVGGQGIDEHGAGLLFAREMEHEVGDRKHVRERALVAEVNHTRGVEAMLFGQGREFVLRAIRAQKRVVANGPDDGGESCQGGERMVHALPLPVIGALEDEEMLFGDVEGTAELEPPSRVMVREMLWSEFRVDLEATRAWHAAVLEQSDSLPVGHECEIGAGLAPAQRRETSCAVPAASGREKSPRHIEVRAFHE